MTRKLTTLIGLAAVAAVLAMPGSAGAAAGLATSLSAGQCSQEKTEIGKKAFRKKYFHGRKSVRAGKAMSVATSNCVKRGRAAATDAVAIATDDCQYELDENGPEYFYEDWASFDECVEDYAYTELNGGFEEDPGVVGGSEA